MASHHQLRYFPSNRLLQKDYRMAIKKHKLAFKIDNQFYHNTQLNIISLPLLWCGQKLHIQPKYGRQFWQACKEVKDLRYRQMQYALHVLHAL